MQLDRRIVGSMESRWKALTPEIEGRAIGDVDGLLQIDAEVFAGVPPESPERMAERASAIQIAYGLIEQHVHNRKQVKAKSKFDDRTGMHGRPLSAIGGFCAKTSNRPRVLLFRFGA